MNSVNITGRLTDDVAIRYTSNENAVVGFTIANDVGYGDKKKTSFIRVVAWRNLAEFVSKYAHRGDELIISGRLNQRTYAKNDGTSAEVVEVIADTIEKGKASKKNENNGAEESAKEEKVSGSFAELDEDEGDFPF